MRLAGLGEMARQWERETVAESPFIQTLIEDSYKRGHKEGQRENALATLHEILKVRFDTAWEEIGGGFAQFDTTALQRLNVAASTLTP